MSTTSADFFCIIADNTFDQIVQGYEARNREVTDLRMMGCKVRSIGPMTSLEADAEETRWARK